MKEVLAIIRMDMINQTKQALLKEGFPALNCRKVMGRGKKSVDFSFIESMVAGQEITSPKIAESVSEAHRFIPKRLLSMVVNDEDARKVVDTIIDVNSSGKPGDGKIFVSPVSEVIRVRTGETGEVAI